MSKHKHLHSIKTPAQMLSHTRRERIGPLDHRACKKKTAADTAKLGLTVPADMPTAMQVTGVHPVNREELAHGWQDK